MSEPFRIAIIGAGMITQSNHLPAAIAHPGIEIAAIVDRDRMRARELCVNYGLGARALDDVAPVLGALDGCVIATPNNTHAEIALQCIDAGVPAIVEKPIATTCEAADAVAARAEARNVVISTGYCTRFRDSFLILEDLLRRRVFGEARRFVYQSGTAGGWAPLSGYTLERDATGGGVTVVSGTHFLDHVLNLFGWPQSLAYSDDAANAPEANAQIDFVFPDTGPCGAVTGSARFSKTVSLKGGLVIETDRGRLVVPDADDAKITFQPASEPDLAWIVERRGPPRYPAAMDKFVRQYENFIRAVRGEEPVMVDARQGARSVALLDALYRCRAPMSEDWHVGDVVAETAS